MKKGVQRLVAAVLALTVLFGFGSFAAFAADEGAAAETTTAAAEESENTGAVADGLNFFEKIANFIYDLLDFLYQQYKIFVVGPDGDDTLWWMFKNIV